MDYQEDWHEGGASSCSHEQLLCQVNQLITNWSLLADILGVQNTGNSLLTNWSLLADILGVQNTGNSLLVY